MDTVANPDKALRRFNDALRRVMSASKEDLDRELANEKEANEGISIFLLHTMEEDTVTDAGRVDAALNIGFFNAGFDGGHHKQWVIDQMIRALTQDGYDEWVRNWENGEDGPKSYEWDTGIAP